MRSFLYIITALVVLFIAGAFAYRVYERELTEYAFVPRGAFEDQPALAANAYEDAGMWYSRPGMRGRDPSRYMPEVAEPEPGLMPGAATPEAAPADTAPEEESAAPPFVVFFVHPTSYIPVGLTGQADWNAALGDAEAEQRARLFLRGMASPFGEADEVWAPKYRQASFGAFLTDRPEAQLALALAYRDVAQAFEHFLEAAPRDAPIVLAGHSQGALHVLTLLRERVLGTPLEQRIAMVYPIGWPISVASDLPALGLPACETPEDARCIATWSSFAEPADPGMLFDRFTATPGFDGEPRGEGPILCVNPVTGTRGGAAAMEANLGTLRPAPDFSSGELVAGAVPARCDAETGLLLIGEPPQLGDGVLPGNNYHVYDIPLFWANLRQDVARRLATWTPASE